MTTLEPIPSAPAFDALTRRADTWPTHRSRDRRRRYLIRAEARDRRRAHYDPDNPRRR